MTMYTFDKKTNKVIKKIRKFLNLSSKTEVLRRALALLVTAVENQEKGGSIYLEDANGTKTKVLL